MRKLLSIALLVSASTITAISAADTMPDMAAMQAGMQLMSTPTAEHAMLAKSAGVWDVQSSMWMAPGAPPVVSKGTATITSIHAGKWIKQDYTGEMMGQPYTGTGIEGYDTVAKQYVSTWSDSFSTMLTTMTGTTTDGGKTITYTSRLEKCPMTGGPLNHRSVLVNTSENSMTFTMYSTPEGGSESKNMELVYTRRAK